MYQVVFIYKMVYLLQILWAKLYMHLMYLTRMLRAMYVSSFVPSFRVL